MMKKPNLTLFSPFRLRSVLISVALVIWWAVVMVHFSIDRRPPAMRSSLGQPLFSLQIEEAKPKELPTESNYIGSTRRNDKASVTARQAQGTWQKKSRAAQIGDITSGGTAGNRVSTVPINLVPQNVEQSNIEESGKSCQGRYIYVYELDPYFNEDLVKHCDNLNLWTNWCPSVENAGLGPLLNNTDGVFSDSDWYITNQFMLEQIFHNRMRQYKCLAKNSTKADAVFVPYYAGFEIATKLWGANLTVRDAAPNRLYNWLTRQAEWKRFNGHDHFLVGGRITWDFRRRTDEESDWGNKLFVLPPGLNMTLLAIEASPWHFNDVAIPYPTYFHPSSKTSIEVWQKRMHKMVRTSLFSFVGAPRPGVATSIRGKIMEQCIDSKHCRLLNCNDGDTHICNNPHKVMEIFEHSIFCLQPQGDSYTRRSIFDSMLAGCIPVFFHYFSAYSQYEWHLPSNHSSYSVLIEEAGIQNNSVNIEKVLLKYTPEQVASMRQTVVKSIPGLVYADPRTEPLVDVTDAFDIAVQGVIDRIAKWKKKTKGGTLDDTDVDWESPTDSEQARIEHVAMEEAMKKSEKETGLRENNSVVKN